MKLRRPLTSFPPSLATFALFLGSLLAVSNYYFVRQNIRLREKLKSYEALQVPPIGVQLPPLHGKDINGHGTAVSYDKTAGRETLLFVFSPLCGYCKKTWPAWTELAAGCWDKRIVYVNTAGAVTADYLRDFSVGSALLVAQLDAQSRLDYRLNETPITVLVAPDGRAVRVWGGLIDESRLAELKREVRWHRERAVP